ncbi:hypothetical protein [Yersinia massiliensis]|uniref:Uncharacterized protein n=1 Tax=Yersinia massiliensis TaxID=419257 RepID=A0ABM6URS6_9GAMM|nr:hypothetical protein [Yersinia massiliensis]AVX37784.1 hypothetical protein DA391_08995 [Yersinia massiliensis]
MEREERYIVIKRSDAEKYLGHFNFQLLDTLENSIKKGRDIESKPPLQCVVVESDWPEYETVWSMIESRVDGISEAVKPREPVSFDALADAVQHVTGGIRMEFDSKSDKGHQAVPFMNFNSLSRIVEMFRAPINPVEGGE